MATQRHHRAGIVLATATALLFGGSLPAQAASATPARTTNAISSHTLQLAQPRLQARRAALALSAAHLRTRARIDAVHAAQVAQITAARAAGLLPAVPVVASSVVTAPVVTAPVVTAPVDALSPSGQAAPRGDLAGWKQTYVEDFGTKVATGSWPGAYGSHWYAYNDGSKDTSRNGTYMPSKVLSVHDGVLDYSIRTEGGQHLVSAPVVKDTYGQVYGRYSVRFRSDTLKGYKTAWLLWPDTQRWPDDGEIDFPEGNLDGTIGAFSHFASSAGGQDEFGSSSSFDAWHTATIEWVPGKVSFALDGKVLGSSTKDVPATAMHWVLQTETSLSGAAPATGVAGHVLVDWVALYKRA